jgi:competence protein ComEC
VRTRLGPDADDVDAGAEPVDLRLAPAAVAIWLGVLAGLHARPAVAAVIGGAGAAVGLLAWSATSRVGARLAVGVALLALLAGLASGTARAWSVHGGPVTDLAGAGATVTVHGVVMTEPAVRVGAAAGGEAYAVGRLRIEEVSGRGSMWRVRTPVLLVASDPAWHGVLPGTRVAVQGQLGPAGAGDLAAVLRTSDGPRRVGPPSAASRLTEPLRQGLRVAAGGLADAPRGLVPGLAVGDESGLDPAVRDDLRATGLTHLTAVSGMHVSIVLVAVLGVARWAGARGYALPIVAVLAIGGFALLVRPDPSVIRASTMGLIGVLGLTVAGRKRALPALAAAVVVLLLVDPWLARSIGFALSVLSTAGILVLAPVWRDALRWLPRTGAEALAVPLAAQVASAPVLVAFVSETSLASVPANVLVAPAVAPATLLGVLAAVVAPVSPTAAAGVAWLAGWPAGWIALVAEHGARLPGAVLRWPAGPASVAASAGLVAVLIVGLPRLLRRPLAATGLALVALVVLVVAPTPGWPPRGWLVVACPVGQGDAFVVTAGPGSAVVVDAGPDPAAIDRCLTDLRIRHIPVLVLTHFHADHVDGVPGVLDGRRVDEVIVSPLSEPAEPAQYVARWLAAAGVPATLAAVGEQRVVGDRLGFRVVWPVRIIGSGEPAANDASVVLDLVVDGVRVLLTGDVEPPAQAALRRAEPTLRADVLKVPHHGSRFQDHAFLAGLGAQVALIGVGLDNRHGHPAAETMELLDQLGILVGRTDTDGAVAVVRTPDGQLGMAVRGVGVFAR